MRPLCSARRTVETAAHLTDHVLPELPLRQWILAVPKRLRYFRERDADLRGAVSPTPQFVRPLPQVSTTASEDLRRRLRVELRPSAIRRLPAISGPPTARIRDPEAGVHL